MRLVRLFFILFFASAILVGCQTVTNQNPSDTNPEGSTESPGGNEGYPQPMPVETSESDSNAYPAPSLESQAAESETFEIYPDLKDGDEVDWGKAVGIILSGQVSQVLQTHDLKVYLTLKDGRTIVSTEPVIDELMGLINYCGDPCKDIKVATE